jgi:anti-sigma B factor antagonist
MHNLSQNLAFPCGCAVDETWSGSAVVLSVSGALDMLTAGTLSDAIDAAFAQHPTSLVFDLSDVDFLASHGMNVMVAAHFRAGSGISVVIVADGPVTARPLTLTGISEIIAMHPTLDGALIGLAAA